MATRHYYTTNVTSEEQWKKYVQEEDEKRKKRIYGDSSRSDSNKSRQVNATTHHYTTNVTSEDQWKDFIKEEDEKKKKRMYGDSTQKSSSITSSTQSTFNKPQTQQKAETFKASIPTKSEPTFSASTLSDDVSKGTPSVNLAADAQADFSKTNEEAYKKYLQYTTKPSEKKGLYSKLNPNAKETRTPEEQLDVASDYLSQFTDEQKKMLDAYTNYKRQYDEQMLWSNSLANIGAIGGGGSIDPSMANEQSQYLKGMNESLAQFQESTGLSDEDVQLAIEYAGEVSDRKTRDIQREGFQKNAHDYNNQGWNFETGEKKASTKDVKKTLKAAGGKVFNTLMSAGAQMQSGGWAVGENIIHKFGGYADENAPVNTNSAYYELNNISNDAKAATLKEIEDNNNQVDAFLYKAASSGLENYVRTAPAMMFSQLGTATKFTKALGEKASLLPMAANVFSTTVENAQNQGMTADEAQMAGTISATIEYATEKAGFDAVFDNLIVKSNSAFAKRLLASMAAEAGEEFVSGAVSPTLEAVMFGDKSEAIRKYNDLIDDGISESEAKKQVVWEYFKDALSDAAVAAVSTLMMSGPIEVSKDISDTKSGKEVFADDNYKEVAEGIDDTLDIGKEAKAYAEKLADKVENGEKVTSNEKRALWSMVNSNVEQSQQAHENDLKYREIVDEYQKGTPAENSAKGFSNFMQQTNDILTQKVTNPEMPEEAQVETELRELSPMDNMLVEESEGKSPAYISGVKGEEFAPSNIDEEIAYNEGQQYRTQRKSEENNPKTATAIRGNEKFKIASIKNVKGEPYITTDRGVTMPLSEASIVNDNVQTLYNNASKHDNAQAYIDGYNPNIPVKAYSSAMENVYNYARLHGAKGTFDNAIKNEPYKDKIDKASLKAMYEEGLKDTQTKSKKVTKSGKKAQGKVTDENNRLSKNGRKLMKAISDKLGVDVEIVDNQMTVDGKTVNGFFDVDNNKIVLNPDGQNVFKTLIHEVMGEMSEAYSSEKMDELQLAIIDYELAHNPKKFNDTVENYRQAYIKHEGSKSYREAADEYVNDILVELFNDEQGMKDFANFIADKQSVKETFLEFIDNIVSAIKELMGNNTNSRFKDDIVAMQRLRKMALDTWQTAIDNKLALENGGTELKQASSLDVRNSINVDTEGRELNDSKKEFFKNSKIVDKDGRLLVLYHGTPVGGFNEFRNPLNFFTPNRAYAERYANQDSKTGEIYEVYLNVEKPFDITNPEDRQIFIDEYVKGGWSYSIDPSLSDKEIAERIKDGIDWTEADNLKEFLEENDYDYDGLILNEGGDFEYGDRDNSYVIFESRQAKRVDNENPTQDADIRFALDVPEEESKTLIAIHNLSAEQMLKNINLGGFPMPSIAVTTTELGHTDYGDVSVLFGKDTIDPAKSRKNKIYGGDAWTPTVPRLESKINEKVAEKMRKKIYGLVDTDEQHALGFVGLDNENMENEINNRRGDVIEANRDKRLLKYAFLKDNGIGLDIPQTDKRLSNKFDNDQVLAGTKVVKDLKQAEDLRMNTRSYENHPEIVEGLRQALNEHFRQKHADALKGTKLAEKDLYDELSYSDFDQLTVGLYKYYRDGITQEMDSSAMRDAIDEKMEGREEEYDKWLHELFDGIVEKQGLRNNKELFTYSGNRRSWESLHDEYNLDNIVKLMGQQDAKGEAGFFSVSKIQALATKNFKNLSEVRKAKNQLRMETEEEREARVDEQSQRFSEICQEISDKRESNPFIAVGRASDAIADAVSKYHTVQGIDRELREWTGLNIQDDTAQKIVDLMKDIAENPTGYFEAKPQRAVELSEIERVIVPHLEKDLMAALDEKNIPYTTYKAGDDEARKAAVNSVPEIRFSIKVDTEGNKLTKDQQRYFADSKVVDEEGRLKVMYHGTEEATFTKFDLGKMDDGRSIFLTDSKIVAQTYSAEDSIVDPYNIRDLETEEGVKKFFEETDYELRKTEDGYEIYDSFNDDVAWKNESLFGLMMQYAYDMGMYNLNGGIYKTYVNLVNPLIVDAEDKNWDDLEFEIDGGVFNTTRDVAEYAYITGYDGVIFKGLIDLGQYSDYADMDGSSDVAVAFNPNQVKSTNNLNPTDDEDIRFSLDVDYQKAYEEGNTEEMDRLVRIAAEENGYDSPKLYHGTDAFGFTQFDLDKMDDKQSIFLTNNPKIASTYAGDTAFWEGGAVGSYGESRLRAINESIPGDVFKMSMEEVADNLNKIKSNKKAGRTFRAYNRKQLEADRPKILKDIKDASNSIKSIDTSRFNNNEKESYKTLRDIINNNSVDEIYDKAHVFRDFYMNLLSLMEQDDNISRIGTELYSYGLLQKVNRPFSDDVVALLYDGVVSEVLEPYMARKRLKQATKEAIYSLYAKLGNSLVIDGKGRYWNHIKGWSNLENEPTKTRDIADYAKKNGYDSVIFKNLKDNGGRNDGNVDYDETADIYVIFNPNDIKSADTVTYDEDGNVIPLSERFNPENPDIRFSIEVEDKISDIKKRAEKRFSFDQADLDLLDSLAEGQNYNKVADDTMAQILSSINNLYKGQEVGAKSIQTVAKEIKEYTGSTISTSKLEEQLKTLFDYMQRADNELNTGEMFDMFKIVAGDVVDKMASEKVDDSFRDFMRTETFRLTDDQKKEVAHVFGSYDNFRKKYFGTLNIRNDATSTLDGLWNEITEQSFYGLDRDTPEAEQPIALVDFLDAMKDQPINNFGASFDELSTDVAIRILEKYFAAEQQAMTNKALLDNPSAKKALDDARANMRKADQEFRKQVKEKYDEEVARLTKERDDAQSSSQFFYNRARDLENKLANASNEEDKKAIRKLQSELDKKEKALIKAKAQSKAPLSAYQEQLGRADEKRKIMQISNRLMKMVYAPTEKLHMPEEFREPIGEFLNGIDFITHRGDLNSIDKMRWQTRMDNLRHYLSELSSKSNATQNELNLAELLEDELLEDMEKFTRDHAEDKKISRMSKDDLHKLYGILTRLSATVSKTNETFANSVYADMTKLNVDSYNELVEMNDRNVGNGVMQSIKDFFGKSLEDPITYFSLLGKAPKSLFDGLLKGFDRRTSHIKEAQEYMEFLPKDAYKWEKEKHTFVINGTYDVKGEELELTTTQIMTLYELNKRKAASHHLFSGGIKALNTHLLGYTSQSRKAYHLTETDLKNIFGVLTQEQIDAADKMQEFMSTNCADWGNNVSMTLWGYKKFTEKDYFPMKVDSDSRATSNKDTNVPNYYSNKNISASKELKEMADNPLLIGDIFDVFTDHVADMATYDGMVLPQMDAMRWFNYKVKEVDGQGRNFISGTKQEINRIYGQAGLSYFTNLMLGINGAEPKARGVRLQNALIGRYKKVAVTAKIRVAIQQPTAFVRAYDEMDGKYLTKALATTNPVKYSKIAKQNSNLAWWKGQGYYESYLGKGLKEIIVGKNPVIQKVEDFEGWGAQTMDDLTWGILYHASELEVKDKHPDLKGKEFTDAVVERFEDLVSKTQVVDTMLHRTDIMRSQGDLTKLATSFMTEPLKTYNMLMRSVVGAARDKDKKALRKLIRTLFVYVANAAILSMVTTTWDALRKDDDETKYTDKWLELYGQEAVDNLNPLQMIPFVKDVVDIVNAKLTGEYRNATDMTYEGITKAAQFVAHIGKKITGEDLTVSDYGLAKEGVQALSILSGVPAYNVWNDIEGIHNGFFDNWETKVQSPYKDFYKAIDEDGDIKAAVENLRNEGKDDKTIKGQITKRYRPTYLDTTDMTEKANLKNKLIKAYTAAGDTREQAIKKIDKW